MAEPTTDSTAGGGETVLVVEDQPAVMRFAVKMLHSLGYSALEAVDGESCLALLEEAPNVDLVLCDLLLPGGRNGVQLAEDILQRRPKVRILFMSGNPETALAHDGNAGHLVLRKPFEQADLARKMRQALATETVNGTVAGVRPRSRRHP